MSDQLSDEIGAWVVCEFCRGFGESYCGDCNDVHDCLDCRKHPGYVYLSKRLYLEWLPDNRYFNDLGCDDYEEALERRWND